MEVLVVRIHRQDVLRRTYLFIDIMGFNYTEITNCQLQLLQFSGPPKSMDPISTLTAFLSDRRERKKIENQREREREMTLEFTQKPTWKNIYVKCNPSVSNWPHLLGTQIFGFWLCGVGFGVWWFRANCQTLNWLACWGSHPSLLNPQKTLILSCLFDSSNFIFLCFLFFLSFCFSFNHALCIL